MKLLLQLATCSLPDAGPAWAQGCVVSVGTCLAYCAFDRLTSSAALWGRLHGLCAALAAAAASSGSGSSSSTSPQTLPSSPMHSAPGASLPPRGYVRTDGELRWRDTAFVWLNRAVLTPVYFRHTAQFWQSEASSSVEWGCIWGAGGDCSAATLLAVLPQCLAMFALYDLIYVPWHRFLHVPVIYPYIHKHHHQQLVCFRGTYDGINTHPVEFLSGIYLHLLSIVLLQRLLVMLSSSPFLGGLSLPPLQGAAVLLFYVCSGLMASLNHTRHAVHVPAIFDVRDHDVHHRLPRNNYGQYVMWWDRLCGSYLPYDAELPAGRKTRIAGSKDKGSGEKRS
jgi:sterol desaturase/sphingolipid hydroxylase (fatty acid hydroxylase superfamily)